MNSRDQIERRIKRLKDTGQIMHCPDCGHGFPVTDPGTGAVLEKILVVIEATRIYRKHMLGEIEPVMSCGMRLDEALAALDSEQ